MTKKTQVSQSQSVLKKHLSGVCFLDNFRHSVKIYTLDAFQIAFTSYLISFYESSDLFRTSKIGNLGSQFLFQFFKPRSEFFKHFLILI